MLTVSFDCRSQPKQLGFRQTNPRHSIHGGFSLGQSAGLVEQNGVHHPHPFERETILHKDPCPRGDGGRDRDDERDRQNQARVDKNNEDRDGASTA